MLSLCALLAALPAARAQNALQRVAECWSVPAGADWPAVTVAFSLTGAGRVVDGSIRLVDATGTEAEVIAFEAARRAILRCQGAGGYDLPADAPSREVQLTFDPTRM